MTSPKPPKVLVIKSAPFDDDESGSFVSTSLSNSLPRSPLDNSLYESTASSLTDLPIQPASTYVSNAPPSPSSNRTGNNSPTWDYENYIEKPRGKVAEPRYVSPSSSQDYTARSFVTDQPQVSYTSVGISPTVLAILAYFFGFLGGFVIMILEKKNLFVVFHAWQSMVVGLFAFVVQIVFVWSKSIYTLLWITYLVFDFFMIARVIMDGPTQRLFKLPIVGDWCEHKAFNKIQRHAGEYTSRMEP